MNLLFLLSGLVLGTTAAFAQKSASPPNIILIIADDIGWQDLSCYGNPVIKTEWIDSLAKAGIRFNNAYVTTSSCSPSRASIITGRYPHNTGAPELHTSIPEGMFLFPDALKKAGYTTLHAGKWHMGTWAKKAFDVSIEDKKLNGDGGEDQWINTLKNRDKSKPFFAWLAAFDAHRPWETGNPYEMDSTKLHGSTVPPFFVNNAATRADLKKYYDEVLRFDASVGNVVAELKRQGIFDNTLIVVMSDNGRPFPRNKTTLYDDGVKTPLVLSWPAGIKHSIRTSDALVSTIDLAPTLLQLAGCKPHVALQGRSFAKLLQNPKLSFRNYVYTEHNWHDYRSYERAVRTKDYLYIHNFLPTDTITGSADLNGSPTYQSLLQSERSLTNLQNLIFHMPASGEELYEIRKDSQQVKNLVTQPAYQKKRGELKAVLNNWMKTTGDEQPNELTPDWYNRTDGKPLKTPQLRGTLPGSSTNARHNNHKEVF